MTEPAPKPAEPLDADAAPSSGVPVSVAPNATPPGAVSRLLSDILTALRFFSRLPVPVMSFETQPHAPIDLARAAPAVAIAGAVIGAMAALVLLGADAIGFPPLLTAIVTLATATIVTGALHDDGLADTADGLWGGTTPARRLDIMRDSRIGSYGVCAILLAMALRITAVATLIEHASATVAAFVIVAVAATSRVASLLPLWLLPPARADGAAAAVTPPTAAALACAALIALGLSMAALWRSDVSTLAIVASTAAAYTAAWLVARLAKVKIGGHTGDIAGAAQQAAEITMLLALVIAVA